MYKHDNILVQIYVSNAARKPLSFEISSTKVNNNSEATPTFPLKIVKSWNVIWMIPITMKTTTRRRKCPPKNEKQVNKRPINRFSSCTIKENTWKKSLRCAASPNTNKGSEG